MRVVVAHERADLAFSDLFEDDRDSLDGPAAKAQDDAPCDAVLGHEWSHDAAFVSTTGAGFVVKVVHLRPCLFVGELAQTGFGAGGWAEPGPFPRVEACVVVLELAPSGGSRRSPSGAALARGARPPAVPAPSAAREALHRVLPFRGGERRDPDGDFRPPAPERVFNGPRRSLGLPSGSGFRAADLR
jgi:hypothetical protein